MPWRVIILPQAQAQLDQHEERLSEWAGPETAFRNIEEIVRFCWSLTDTPYRGTRRDDLKPGLRTIGFKRRATILFSVEAEIETVVVSGIAYGGQDYEAAFRDED